MKQKPEPASSSSSRATSQKSSGRYAAYGCASAAPAWSSPRDGGALAGLAPLFRLGLGAVAGSGAQWISWVHMHDLLNLFERFMQDASLSGAFNNTVPGPVTNHVFSRAIGRALHRPVLLRLPGRAMRLLVGEMAHRYLPGQRTIPAHHLQAGFAYRYPDIEAALREEPGARHGGA